VGARILHPVEAKSLLEVMAITWKVHRLWEILPTTL
jgi:hypothetical protein